MELNSALVEGRSQPCPLLFSCYKNVFVSLHVFTFHRMILRIPTQVLLRGVGVDTAKAKPTGVNFMEPDNLFGGLPVSGGLLGLLG